MSKYAGYIRLSDRKYPCTIADIGADHPTKYIPDGLSDAEYRGLGYAIVTATEQPTFNHDCERITQGDPVETAGRYQQTWDVVDIPEAEQVAMVAAARTQSLLIMENHVRSQLNAIARAKDYDSFTQCVGYVGCKNATWSTEGGKLRDFAVDAWAYYYSVEAGTTLPTMEQFIAGFPAFSWE